MTINKEKAEKFFLIDLQDETEEANQTKTTAKRNLDEVS